MKTPAVSVLLCVHNPKEKELTLAVDSILGQTFSDWEMILYDDGSDREFENIVYLQAGRDKRIRYVKNYSHHSLAYGLNVSLRLAKGEYIARMDGDDIAHPDRLEKEWKFLREHPEYDYVGCQLALIDEKGKWWGVRRYPLEPKREDFLPYLPYPHPAMMLRKDILLAFGGYGEGEKPRRGEDYELFMRLHAAGKRGANLDEILFDYREYRGSYRRRKLRFQLQEVGIRLRGFRELGLPLVKNLRYVVKPALVWLAPDWLLFRLRRGRAAKVSELGKC